MVDLVLLGNREVKNMKKEIQNCFIWLVNRVSESNIYNWSNVNKNENNKEAFNSFYDELKKYIDFTSINIEDAKELGFKLWDETMNLWLFPLYLTPIIPEGLEIMYIDGSKGIYIKDTMDNDIRFGCVAYGIEIIEK